ncbi:hypothetical protein NL676_012352 [Syzygium grande]|nr:hypothetical protein NL676_012352 [Syzygium grande]
MDVTVAMWQHSGWAWCCSDLLVVRSSADEVMTRPFGAPQQGAVRLGFSLLVWMCSREARRFKDVSMAAATRVMPGMARWRNSVRTHGHGLVRAGGRSMRRHGLEQDRGTCESDWCSGGVARRPPSPLTLTLAHVCLPCSQKLCSLKILRAPSLKGIITYLYYNPRLIDRAS